MSITCYALFPTSTALVSHDSMIYFLALKPRPHKPFIACIFSEDSVVLKCDFQERVLNTASLPFPGSYVSKKKHEDLT